MIVFWLLIYFLIHIVICYVFGKLLSYYYEKSQNKEGSMFKSLIFLYCIITPKPLWSKFLK